MVGRVIVWTETAARQRRVILKYWTIRNGTTTYAERLIRLATQQIKIISQNPYSFKKADYPDTHVSAMGHFSIFYKITSEKIIITAFWDNRQDPKKLLGIIKD
jgi:plasmid stabilization system protein ParE